MTLDRVIVVGGSSGALDALRTIVAGLPPDLAAAILVVIHVAPNAPGIIDRILSHAGPFQARYPESGETIRAGTAYVAPPDRHLLVQSGRILLTRGPRENSFRPAVDPLFRTAAAEFGPRVIGVVLSGGQDDGAAGLATIKRAGGDTLAQDPDEAFAPGMPMAAIRTGFVDHVLAAKDLAAAIIQLVTRPISNMEAPMAPAPGRDAAERGAHDIHHTGRLGAPSPFTCPECGGTLWQAGDAQIVQHHCHVGHRYSSESLAAAKRESLEQALWAALRALEESAELHLRMAQRARSRGLDAIGAANEERAAESEQRATIVRRALMPDSVQKSSVSGAETAGSNDESR